jgi:hypothetical protein
MQLVGLRPLCTRFSSFCSYTAFVLDSDRFVAIGNSVLGCSPRSFDKVKVKPFESLFISISPFCYPDYDLSFSCCLDADCFTPSTKVFGSFVFACLYLILFSIVRQKE